MSLNIPYPDLDFVPLDVLSAEEMNQIVSNYTYISDQFPITSSNIDWSTYDFLSEIQFNETGYQNCTAKRFGKIVALEYYGPAHTHRVGSLVMKIPTWAVPSTSVGGGDFMFPFTKNETAYGVGRISSNGEITTYRVSSESSNGRLSFSLSYFIA